LAERVLGKDEVTGSIPVISSNSRLKAGELSTVARSAKVDRQNQYPTAARGRRAERGKTK
jgi:hypothetical protein